MAKTRSTSSLMKKLGSAGAKAVAAHKNDAPKTSGMQDPPAGIEDGIAQLCDCEFSNYKTGDMKGELYFRAAGIIVEPEEINDIKVAGRRTQIMEPICETPGRKAETVADHVLSVINQMKLLGIDGEDIDEDCSNLEDIAKALEDEKPHFRFRTWVGKATEQYPNPKPQSEWLGVCDYVPTDEDDEVVETEDASVIGDPEEGETEDLDELAKDADGGNEEAQTKITDTAGEKGIDPDTYETWSGVVEAINSASDDAEPEAEEEEEIEPEKGEIYNYKPPKARKFVDCDVTAVFEGKKTCNLKNLTNQKVYKAVPWSRLVEIEEE